MPIEPRLIVTGHSPEGDAIFVEDRRPDTVNVQALPGPDFFLLWGTPEGASRALFLRWAPYSSEPEPAVDPQVVADEVAEKLPGLLDVFEEGGDGMHTTDTVDYAICLEGELTLRLDNDAEVTLTPGTCVVQLGTRHAWKNRSDQPALMCYVQIGAIRVG
jgi:quercetin dioxygenase-like cupin family protein